MAPGSCGTVRVNGVFGPAWATAGASGPGTLSGVVVWSAASVYWPGYLRATAS